MHIGVLMYEMMAGRSPFDTGPTMGADNPDQNTEELLFQVILERVIRIPRSLSVRASKVLKGFLNKNPEQRLGCEGENGFQDIVNHDFFRTIDWRLLEEKQLNPVSYYTMYSRISGRNSKNKNDYPTQNSFLHPMQKSFWSYLVRISQSKKNNLG